jgi:hypothetical protein
MNHYDWLEKYLDGFVEVLFPENEWERWKFNLKSSIVADGDKCYQYEDRWQKAGIPFSLGVAIYFLTYYSPFSRQVRQVGFFWVDPCDWVIGYFVSNEKKLMEFYKKTLE